MPRIERNGWSLYYATDGDGETVAFVGDLGYGAWQWAAQHEAVAGPFEALVWDHRGAGRSDAPAGPYSVGDLAADLEAVLAETRTSRAHLVGAGLGGLVALRYALDYARARTLTLLATSAGGPHLPEDPVGRLFAPADDEAALRETLRPVLTEAFLAEQQPFVDAIVRWRAGRPAGDRPVGDGSAGDGSAGDSDGSTGGRGDSTNGLGGDAAAAGWRAQAAAIEGFDVRERLYEVTEPALVIHGTDDDVWPPAGGQALAEGLPRGRFEAVEGGPHLVGVERPRLVNDLLVGFLEEHGEST